ncbi:hypothetical protein WJX79_008591 [Trebouxia sp. C0005]
MQMLAPNTADSAEWVVTKWDAAEHLPVIESFLSSLKVAQVFAWLDKLADDKLMLSTSLQTQPDKALFFTRDTERLILPDNIQEVVQVGVIQGGDTMQALLRLMSTLYAPQFITGSLWPESIQKDFIGQLHKFLARLTETSHGLKGRTVLYLPQGNMADPVAAAADKDLVQRLESITIHWTRQIKEVVNQQEQDDAAEHAGPLAEIEFWRSRTVDLGGIRDQLDDKSVLQVVAILEQTRSSYLATFLSLRKAIQQEAVVAEDNLKFLQCLEQPCRTLASATAKDIPKILPLILNCVRMIWSLSRFYNTPERLVGLLRKLSNEIINRCCSVISLPDIFSGDVDNVIIALEQSIEAGKDWKVAYEHTAKAVAARAPKPWSFDVKSVFYFVDAFKERCRDLLEVCEAQLQFGTKAELPVFGGSRGPDISKSISDIQASFQKLIKGLQSLDYSILDVNGHRWHDDYNKFKAGIKDLEAFQTMAKRESIKRAVERKTADFQRLFIDDLNMVKKQFDLLKRVPPADPVLPRYAGQATMALVLAKRVDSTWQALQEVVHMLPVVPEAAEASQQYEALHAALHQFVEATHAEWYNGLEGNFAGALANNLLLQDKTHGGLLVMNFDKQLLKMLQEVNFWERLRLTIPYTAMEVNAQRERYRILRVNVQTVVRMYNKVLTALDKEERRLFYDRLRYLDKRVTPGVNKLAWTSPKATLDFFYKEACTYCKEAENTVIEFKAALQKAEANCRLISETMLLKVERKRMYDHREFAAQQAEHHVKVQDRFRSAYQEVKTTMAQLYSFFQTDSEEVQREWLKFTHKIDKKMEDALRHTVKRSLQELSRVLNGDNKTEVVPVFTVTINLGKTNRVELKPTVQDLFNMIHSVSKEMITVIQCVPRIAERITPATAAQLKANGQPEQAPAPTFFDIISGDEDTTLRSIVHITNGVTGIVDKVQTLLVYWEKKYKHMWDQDKDAYIRRYEKAQKPLSAFDADISKYADLSEEVLAENAAESIKFLFVDCGPLKQALVGHCEAWRANFTGLLNAIALRELQALHEYFQSNTAALRRPPIDLDKLAEAVQLHRKLTLDRPSIQARFEPLHDKYRTLEKFEMSVPDAQLAQLDELEGSWAAFRSCLDETATNLERAKDSFRDKLVQMVDTFATEVVVSRDIFTQDAPFSNEKNDVAAAMQFIEAAKAELAAQHQKAAELKSGMDIFNISQPAYKELMQNEKDVDLLEKMWGTISEWQQLYIGWKDGRFGDLKVEEMEEAAGRVAKSLQRLGREIKHWPAWAWIKDIVDSFKKTMPLIMDLRNPAMRPRHWANLMEVVGSKFDPAGPTFTLDSVVKLHLDQHAELIADLSGNASKELAIEMSIQAIATTWASLSLDMAEYKATYKLRSTEEVFAALEDNTVTLSTMKASRFFAVFEKDITYWEKTLAQVSETIELVLTVQRNWMYLENIFIGSEDIRKQLPQESLMFDQVHATFMVQMQQLNTAHNVVQACTAPGVLDSFTDLESKLERIQKSLENYLENKRQQFPRFYFLSSDDLLEILGQAKDPMNVQPHLKKCFEGIKKLDMQPPGSEGRRNYETTGVFSPDGEYLPFVAPIVTEGRPEEWLNTVEEAMFAATKRHLYRVIEENRAVKKEKWVKDNQGQLIITAGQVVWTTECEKALADPDQAKAALRHLKKKWISYLNKLTAITCSKLTKIERNKVVALITIEVHARDVIEKLAKVGCTNANDFEWVSQLRFYWDREQNDCVVKQVLSIFTYGYEYQGNNGRLVITPLTDRCYMTLGAAMFTLRGGNPLGPAGTGKTETVKDFGKALARYVIVFNCSDGVDYKMTGKMFSGLAQTGAWACLDEFNRIEVEVLSVVATQIATVMQAIKERKTRFNFLGQDIRLNSACGIFVTMNPGYAGRSELPDNLKALLRPVSMMVPDFTLIAEIMMFSEGFSTAKVLAKKMIAIMELSQQQLSKQDHYDYGLRSFVIPIARAAGALKRVDQEVSEELIMYRTMLDLIKPKLVYLDLPLFMALLSDLFPGVEQPPAPAGALRNAIEADLIENNLQVIPEFVTKIIQIFDCKVARHGNMIVGKTGAGKSVAWQTLQRAMGRLRKDAHESEQFQKVQVHVINPLALSNNELYGSFDEGTHEWQDGVLARIMRTLCKDDSPDQKWILFDGPVDTLWIESMNTLLDDNKLLTLLSGERISMSPQVSILFEVEDLSQASPATVSRAGMIYLNVEDLGWQPFITSWLATKKNDVLVANLTKLIERYMEATLEHKRLQCKELVATDRLSCVKTLTRLFDALATPENGVLPDDAEHYPAMIELWFQFALIWGIGGPLAEDGRKKFDAFMREMDTRFPTTDTVFEYCADPNQKGWLSWENKLSSTYRPPADIPFFKVMVPTVDTVRVRFIASSLVRVGVHTLLVGGVGVGKTMMASSVLEGLPTGYGAININFSAQTSSNSLQDTIEGKLEKRTKGVFGPPGGKHLIAFIDDLNMPQKSKFGFIPPLELLKLWVDYGFWYDRQRCEAKQIKDMQLMAAMAPPGGGRNAFSQRLQACFSLINVTSPNDAQLKRIFGSLLNLKLVDFDDVMKPLGDQISQGSIEVYRAVAKELLPTPAKSHYLFNTRDLAKIIQGVMQATKTFYDNQDAMLQLWCHETFRIIGDRMWDPADRTWLKGQLDDKLKAIFGTSWDDLFGEGKDCPPFVSFMRTTDNPPYEPVTDFTALKDLLTTKLEDYASEPGKSAMDLVLFRDAILHVCRIHRVLMQPRGNALLVGVGGSGRKSISRLATYVADQKCFSIEISKGYRITEFREDLKTLYRQAGCQNKPTVFLFDETQIVQETFLEDINNILTSGEVPNLFPKDELAGVLDEVRPAAKKEGAGETGEALYAFFLERVRTNLHVILCLSPIGEAFRERCRMFPGLVNCTTIDWFTEWPADALYEVAAKQLADEDLGSQEIKSNMCQVFVTAHQSVAVVSEQMLQELKRHNYVTPTNYLETVRGYRGMLKEKRQQVGDKAGKLKGGLQKLQETGEQVANMQVVCQDKKVVVAEAKTSCEQLLVAIVQDKRVADEQEKQVNAEAIKIGKEAEEANAIASECQAGLDKALPALQAAEDALNVLTKKDMSELKAYAKPPALVELTLSGVMTVLQKTPTWDEAKKQLGDASFMEKLLKFDKDKLNDALLKKLQKFTTNPEFTPEAVGKVSLAAKGLCLWVRAMETYGSVAKDVAPKRLKLKTAQDNLSKKQTALAAAQTQLAEVLAKVQALKDQYESSMMKKKALEEELEDLEGKLLRAEKLLSGLAGERSRWEVSIVSLEAQLAALPGDVALASAFMSYAGPFPSQYREDLAKHTWQKQVKALNLPASEDFDFASFLADPKSVRDWTIAGLPADSFSVENGVMVTRSSRWPLMIDPQGQANKWVKNMEAQNGLRVLNLAMPDLLRQMENAIQFGNPVLLQDVGEELDPSLEPVLAKAFVKRGNATLIKLGDKEIDFNPDFRLYITTKLGNPHYTPEVSTKVMIVNFAVKQQGLEAQLLSTVVKQERADLDRQKNELVVKVAQGKRTQAELEDEILQLLSSATGNLLDNVQLINTLNASKTTWEQVNQSLQVAEATAKQIEVAAAAYKPCSVRAAILYFVLNDLAGVDPMYQFSLDAYNDLFLISIQKSAKFDKLDERIRSLNDYHTYAVYKYTSRGLFERHKLLLSLQMCVRILQSASQVNIEEWQFFLKGGQVLDRSQQPANPGPAWLSDLAWDSITELEHLPNFKGVVGSFETSIDAWERWYCAGEPETSELPGEWEAKCNELQRMVLIRCLRPDRAIFAATSYVANALGRKFVEPPVLDLGETLGDSTPLSPLIFVLSAGVDPTQILRKLALERSMGSKFFTVALGQGQAPIATKLIQDGMVGGHWVFLANCHLMTSWLPALDKIVEGLEAKKPHPDFRLWLSSSPSPLFPIAILQRGIKMTTEPPKGLRANLTRLYNTVSDESYTECKAQHKYQKLLFALIYFHSVLLERRKFRSVGLNIPYDFNDTDYKVSDDLLKKYLDSYVDTPWAALKYLIAEANYGGRVTDELDRRVLNSYLNKFYCEEALTIPAYPLSPLPLYCIPEATTLQGFKDYIGTLPVVDRAEAFGQHPNADIAYQIEDSWLVLESLLSLQPQTALAAGAKSREDTVAAICADLLDQVPGPFDLEAVMKSKASDPSALHVVLLQEVERYNSLLVRLRSSCSQVQAGLKGLVVMSADLDEVADALFSAKVPPAWLKAYPSLKALGPWTRDLLQRLDQLKRWIDKGYPTCYWLAGFTYPTAFLTAVLQTTARRNSIPIDSLSFEYSVVNIGERELQQPPKEGVYVKGMFLEGAGWDFEEGCLCEPNPMELIVPMPVFLFKPVENKKKSQKGLYSCPLYIYPHRTGTRERPSFMINVDLKCGSADSDHWIMRGTALLLSLAT